MTRLAYVAFFAAVIAYAVGCSRRSLIYMPDGGDPCSALDAATCGGNPDCELVKPCVCEDSPAPICVTKGTVFECPLCVACNGLDESACKQASQCRADYCSECSCTPTFVGCVDVGAPASACPAVECVQPACQCDGLDEASCTAQSGCTPNYCVGCNGVETFSGCTAPGQGVPSCSNSCDCHGGSDCSGGQTCVAPGASPGCGVCSSPPSCSADSDCPAGDVCDVAACSCTSGRVCVPACSSAGCATGESCGGDGHCAPTACSSAAQCPAFFDCVFLTGASAHCERRACTGDSDCESGGYCVDGGCYQSLGSCSWPPA